MLGVALTDLTRNLNRKGARALRDSDFPGIDTAGSPRGGLCSQLQRVTLGAELDTTGSPRGGLCSQLQRVTPGRARYHGLAPWRVMLAATRAITADRDSTAIRSFSSLTASAVS